MEGLHERRELGRDAALARARARQAVVRRARREVPCPRVVEGMDLRPSSGGVGIYDAPVGVGMAAPRLGLSNKPNPCGATALSAVLKPIKPQ